MPDVTPILNERQQIIEYQVWSVPARRITTSPGREPLYARIRRARHCPGKSRVTLEPGDSALLSSGMALVGMGASLMTGEAGWGGLTLLCLLAQMGHGWHLQRRLARAAGHGG